MDNKEILYKNEKLTRHLIELKSETNKLSIKDKIKLYALRKYNIPYREQDRIKEILRGEDFLRYKVNRNWPDESGRIHHVNEEPYITQEGLNAIKHNYFELNIAAKVLTTPHTLLNIILIVISILLGLKQLSDRSSINKLENEINRKEATVDSLNWELLALNKIQERNKVTNIQNIDTSKTAIDSLNISKKINSPVTPIHPQPRNN